MLDTVLAMERLGFAFNDGERAVQGRLSSSEIGPEAVRRRLRLILAGKEGTRDEWSRFIESRSALFEREIERSKKLHCSFDCTCVVSEFVSTAVLRFLSSLDVARRRASRQAHARQEQHEAGIQTQETTYKD